jgi:hypothetical protein
MKENKRTLDKKLWTIFSKYIRLRDKDLPCVSCGKIIQGISHAGHYITRKYLFVKFHEDNVHKQCPYCNTFLEGNSSDYRKNLINKVGLERVEWLEENKKNIANLSVTWYKEKIEYYKNKVKEME